MLGDEKDKFNWVSLLSVFTMMGGASGLNPINNADTLKRSENFSFASYCILVLAFFYSHYENQTYTKKYSNSTKQYNKK